MKVRRVTTSAGTARELAEHADGYTANGESQYSRTLARANPYAGPTAPRVRRRPLRHDGSMRQT